MATRGQSPPGSRPVDLVEDSAIREMLLLCLPPTAEYFIHGKQRQHREERSMARQHISGERPIEVLRRDLLCFRGVKKRQICLSQLARAVFVDDFVYDRDRRFGEDTD